jgi:acyl-CoA reductase-like NAD-dependent aldehyde dehydrogenase
VHKLTCYRYKLGDPFDKSTNVGPVISPIAKRSIELHIDDAVSKGAKNITIDNESFRNPPRDGNYVIPTVLTNTTHNMLVMREETFGPVIPIMKVDSDEEAIRLMNDSEYGLTASIWTKDYQKGHELITGLEAGTVFVNRCDFPHPVRRICAEIGNLNLLTVTQELAWTGWKKSGLGCTLGPHGFDAFVKLQSYHIRKMQEQTRS